MTDEAIHGRCLCGAVRFTLTPPLRSVIVCHCRQCARWTGYAVAATAVKTDRFQLLSGADRLQWFSSSDHAARGFCAACGSSLFWKPHDGSRLSVLAGALDPPTGLRISAHIYVADKADFYDIGDDLPQFSASGQDIAQPPHR